MHADCGEEVGIGLAQDRRHGAAGRETRHEHPVGIDRELVPDALGQAREYCRFTGAAPLVAGTKPVPARHGVVAAGLSGVGDQQPVFLGDGVHPGPGGEILRVLRAAVQHHDQALQPVDAGRGDIKAIAPGARRVRMPKVAEHRPLGDRQIGRAARARLSAHRAKLPAPFGQRPHHLAEGASRPRMHVRSVGRPPRCGRASGGSEAARRQGGLDDVGGSGWIPRPQRTGRAQDLGDEVVAHGGCPLLPPKRPI